MLTDTLVNSEGPAEHYRGFSAIFGHFGPIFAYFEGNISSVNAGGTFTQARALIRHYMEFPSFYATICIIGWKVAPVDHFCNISHPNISHSRAHHDIISDVSYIHGHGL